MAQSPSPDRYWPRAAVPVPARITAPAPVAARYRPGTAAAAALAAAAAATRIRAMAAAASTAAVRQSGPEMLHRAAAPVPAVPDKTAAPADNWASAAAAIQ